MPGRRPRGRPHANQSGLPSKTHENPDWFESRAPLRTTAGAPTAAHSLPSMMQLNAAQRHMRKRTTPYTPTRSASRGYRTTKPSESSSSSAVKSPSSAT